VITASLAQRAFETVIGSLQALADARGSIKTYVHTSKLQPRCEQRGEEALHSRWSSCQHLCLHVETAVNLGVTQRLGIRVHGGGIVIVFLHSTQLERPSSGGHLSNAFPQHSENLVTLFANKIRTTARDSSSGMDDKH